MIFNCTLAGDEDIKVLDSYTEQHTGIHVNFIRDCLEEEDERNVLNFVESRATIPGTIFRSLVIYKNNIISCDGMNKLSNILTHENNTLSELILKCHMDLHGLSILIGALKHENNKVRTLNLSENKLEDQHISIISEMLQNPNNKLRHLWLNNNEIGDDGLETITNSFYSRYNKLTLITLFRNKFKKDAVVNMFSRLGYSNNLKSITVGMEHTELTNEYIKNIVDWRKRHTIMWLQFILDVIQTQNPGENVRLNGDLLRVIKSFLF